MLIKRIFSSLILSFFIFGVIIFANEVIFGLIVTILIFIGLIEFYKLCEKNGIYVFKKFSIASGLLFSLLFTFKVADNIGSMVILLILFILLCLFLLEFTKKEVNNALSDISFSLLGIIYIGLPMSFLIPIRFLDGGIKYIIVLIAIVKTTDIVAYIIGSKFGRSHLIPRISPKKSIKGSVAGLISSVLVAMFFVFLVDISLVHLFIIGLILGMLAQVGDLSESLIKRYFNVKDSGKFIPGLGGILDLLDSLIFTIPAFYFYIFYLT